MNFYKLISESYDKLYGEEQYLKHAIIKDNLKIKNNDLILDVGCGTGLFSEFNCKVIGIDPSMELLEKSNNKKNKILALAERLPFKEKAFDKIISVTSMHNFNDIEKSIREIKIVGKDEFVFSILKKSRKFDFIKKKIDENFEIIKMIDGKKDWIFICAA